MSVPTILALAALVASVYALATSSVRFWPLLAVLASGLDVARRFHWVRLEIPHLPLGLLLPGLVVLSGVVVWARASSKSGVSAGAIMLLAGAAPLLVVLFGALR